MKRIYIMSLVLTVLMGLFGFAIEKSAFSVMLVNTPIKQGLSYGEAANKYKADNKPLIVFINSEVEEIQGFIVSSVSKMDKIGNYSAVDKGYVVSWFVDGKHIGVPFEGKFDDFKVYKTLLDNQQPIPEQLFLKYNQPLVFQSAGQTIIQSNCANGKCGIPQVGFSVGASVGSFGGTVTVGNCANGKCNIR